MQVDPDALFTLLAVVTIAFLAIGASITVESVSDDDDNDEPPSSPYCY